MLTILIKEYPITKQVFLSSLPSFLFYEMTFGFKYSGNALPGPCFSTFPAKLQ
jgi:hypothetical protein